MIVEFLFNIIFGILDFVLDLIPFFDFTIDTSAFATFAGIIKTVSYILPLDTMLVIFTLIMAINNYKIIVAILKTIWQLLPFV